MIKFWWQSGSQIWICIVTLVRNTLAEVCTVTVFLVNVVPSNQTTYARLQLNRWSQFAVGLSCYRIKWSQFATCCSQNCCIWAGGSRDREKWSDKSWKVKETVHVTALRRTPASSS